ncbi:hypothetical protein R3Q06_32195 [Rhodococcus erythropolis]|uniref:hypothetical protein n=1 Tax=Rhodococcus erythropolis TaxID=1833 RepID=UPI002949C6BD|nr:hypothetical protein [Rhodococcus erythropolis]MDV6278134.1 hypothetical protein [Rhodococcus erythropolis]
MKLLPATLLVETVAAVANPQAEPSTDIVCTVCGGGPVVAGEFAAHTGGPPGPCSDRSPPPRDEQCALFDLD